MTFTQPSSHGPGVVAIPAGHVQDREATQGPEHLKQGESFAVLLNGQAFGLAIRVSNRIVVSHHITSWSGCAVHVVGALGDASATLNAVNRSVASVEFARGVATSCASTHFAWPGVVEALGPSRRH
jgi:hypothetical protein